MASEKGPANGKSSSSGSAGSGEPQKPGTAGSASKQATGGTGSKRPVTIDLKPEKVAAKPADKPAGSASSSSAASSATPKSEAAKPAGTPSSAATAKPASGSGTRSSYQATASSASTSKPATEPKTSAGSSSFDKATDKAAKPSPAASASSASGTGGTRSVSPQPHAGEGGGVGVFGILVAAVFGGIVVLSGAYGLHVSGLLTIQGKTDPGTGRMLNRAERRIGDLERKLADLSKSSGRNNTRALVTGLSDRITALEKSVGEMTGAASADLSPELSQLKSNLAALSAKVESLPVSEGGGGVAIEQIDERLAALEKSINASQQLSGTVASVETSVGDLKTSVADLETRLQNAEATAKAAQTAVSTSDVSLKTLADSQARASETLATLSADIQTVSKTGEASLGELRGELDGLSKRLATVEATMGDATAREVAARALSVSALKSAVDSGRPYETELAAVKAGLPKDTDLTVLEAHAKTGVAPASVLIAEFPGVARAMYAAFSAPDRSGDILDSLIAGAKSIVAVRGPGDENGTGPEAALRRMENAVSRGDLAAGLEAYKTLPDVAQKAGADWAERAQARVTVDRMTEAASNEVLSMLARKDS